MCRDTIYFTELWKSAKFESSDHRVTNPALCQLSYPSLSWRRVVYGCVLPELLQRVVVPFKAISLWWGVGGGRQKPQNLTCGVTRDHAIVSFDTTPKATWNTFSHVWNPVRIPLYPNSFAFLPLFIYSQLIFRRLLTLLYIFVKDSKTNYALLMTFSKYELLSQKWA